MQYVIYLSLDAYVDKSLMKCGSLEKAHVFCSMREAEIESENWPKSEVVSLDWAIDDNRLVDSLKQVMWVKTG